MLRQILLSGFLVINQFNILPILLVHIITTHALEENSRTPYNTPIDNPWNDYNYDSAYMQYYPYYQPPLTQDSSMDRKKFDMESVNSFMNQIPYYNYPAVDTTIPRPDLTGEAPPPAAYYPMPYFYPDLATPMPPVDSENGTFMGYPWMLDSFFGNYLGNGFYQFEANENETDTDTEQAGAGLAGAGLAGTGLAGAGVATTTTSSTGNGTETPTSTELPTTTETDMSTTTEMDMETTTEIPTEETTTLPPFTIADVKVPVPFLRIEYMISFTFFGLMYGLGFFVLFQSLCVPAAKIAVVIVYLILVKLKTIEPVTLEQALEQLPPT